MSRSQITHVRKTRVRRCTYGNRYSLKLFLGSKISLYIKDVYQLKYQNYFEFKIIELVDKQVHLFFL